MGRREKGKELIPVKRCTAISKQSGKRCKQNCVVGYDVCYYHGAGGGRPLIHGIYSSKLGKTVQERYDEYLAEMKAMSNLTSDMRAEMWKRLGREDVSIDEARNIVLGYMKKTNSKIQTVLSKENNT